MLQKYALIALFLSKSNFATARFHHSDQSHVDQQEKPGVEYYNDIDSYRYPIRWNRSYERSHFIFRSSAGSLNQTKFLYHEQWKIISDLPEDSHLFVQRQVKEDYITQDDQNEFHWSKKVFPNLAWRIAGEGGFFKKWGDIGTGFSLKFLDTITASIDFWSVDHFYNTKNSENPHDIYLKRPKSTIFKIEYLKPQYIKIAIHHSWDHPLTLQKFSESHLYAYEQKISTLNLSNFNKKSLWNMTIKDTKKLESKFYDNLASKQLSSHKQFIEIEKSCTHAHKDHWRVGVNIRKESHQYQQIALPILDNDNEAIDFNIESESPQVTRIESAFFTTYEWLIQNHHWFSSDLWVHKPLIRHKQRDEEASFQTTEVKLGIAWDFIITKGAQLRLNTTWDLDQLNHDYRHNNPIKPWGGGNIQLMIAYD
ncbi:MAG: hypothetical protein AB8C84_08700 [Oligoflexales bacterium]